MIIKIDGSQRPQAPVIQPQPKFNPLQDANRAAKAVYQVSTPQSALAMAQAELAASMNQDTPTIFPGQDILSEAQENISLVAGRMQRNQTGRAAPGETDRSRPRAMLQRLAKQVSEVNPEKMHQYMLAVGQIEDLDDLLDSFKRHQYDPGEIALILGHMLNEAGITTKRRSQLEKMLNEQMDDEDWMLKLFGCLEFGAINRSGLSELRRLYQRASDYKTGLNYWFSQFRKLRDRKRKLKTLIRALSFELAADNNVEDIHLAAVINDLKRILQFLTVEDHSQQMADELAFPDLTADVVMDELIEIAQQAWIYEGWLGERATKLLPEDQPQYGYARRMFELVRMLPEACWEDSEQREGVINAFDAYKNQLAIQEEEGQE
ncbi:TyeA family type III secretion system gatekeeper subunit (plasmid) [Pantoea cypripedii]|uniref:TyeA family type III secretion system gatekeeper subunit n=2 Tax=Pantoea cypripedii TaxID=55209 RepID=A0A6B9G9S9_PANCY|nr:TyeA family type III secretion system gatekeeper subunit [Pantoea cypripedii]